MPAGLPPGRRSRRLTWIAIGVAVGAVALACVLVFVVFHDGIFGNEEATTTTAGSGGPGGPTSPGGPGGPAASAVTPEQAARFLFAALETKDLDALFALFEPAALEKMLGSMPMETAKAALGALLLNYGSVSFAGLEFSTQVTGDTTATVRVVAGTATITNADGFSETRDVTAAGVPAVLQLVQRDGVWYLDRAAMLGGVAP